MTKPISSPSDTQSVRLPDDDVRLPDDDALRHVLLPARGPEAGQEANYQRAYDFWHTSWSATFREVNAEVELRSDVFVMQSEVSAVLHDEQVVGLMLYDFRDLRWRSHQEVSYFKHYPADTLRALRAQNMFDVMVAGQLTVHPEFRRSRVGPFMADTLVGLALRRFLSSSATAMIAFTRNDRKAQEIAYRFGAIPLRQGHSAYGIASDVVAFYRDRVRESPLPRVAQVVERLWAETAEARVSSGLPSILRIRPAENAQELPPEERLDHG